MNRPYRIIVATVLPSLLVTVALAQQPPKPVIPGPSLDVTLKFIQGQLSQQGPVNFAVLLHDSQSGSDGASSWTSEVRSFTYDSTKCTFNYVPIMSANGSVRGIIGPDMSLSYMSQVQVMAAATWWAQEMADEGTPLKSVQIQPPYFILSLGRGPVVLDPRATCTDGQGKAIQCAAPTVYDRLAKTWSFRDESTAKRVAQALVHAVALCGGGSKDPF